MAVKTFITILLIGWASITNSGITQTGAKSSAKLDSTVTVVTSLLKVDDTIPAKRLIYNLMNEYSGETTSRNLIDHLKIKRLYSSYLSKMQDYDGMNYVLEWAKTIEKLCESDEALDLLTRLYNNAGVTFKNAGKYSESKEVYLLATTTLKRIKNPDLILYASIFMNTGNAIKKMGEFDRAIEYFEQSLRYFDQFVEKSQSPDAIKRIAGSKSATMDNLGLVYQALGNHTKAIEVFRATIDFRLKHDSSEIKTTYGNLVISLTEVGKYLETKQIIDKILENYSNATPKDPAWAIANLNLAEINLHLYRDTNRFYKDLDLLNKTILAEIPDAIDNKIVSNQMASSMLLRQGHYSKALRLWSESMESLSLTPRKVSPFEIPYTFKTYKFFKLIELMNLNSQIYYSWGKKLGDPVVLKQAEDRYAYSIQLIDSLRNSLELQSSKLELNKMQRLSYDQLIELDYSLFKMTGDSAYIEKTFNAMEQSKSAALWSSVKNSEFRSSKIDPKDLQKETFINEKITEIQGKIISGGTTLDQKSRNALEQRALFFKLRMDSLKSAYKVKYPDYYSAKYDKSTISLDQAMRKLNANQILIEYSIAFDSLYTVVASATGSNLTRRPISTKSKEAIAFILSFMKGRDVSLNSAARTTYCEAAYNLYELLLGPVSDIIIGKELIIIPDGQLSYLPFEALLDLPVTIPHPDYRKLPYMIFNHSISYGLTATIYFYQSHKQTKPTKGVLTIAPDYDFTASGINDYIKRFESGLPRLKGTYQESLAIRKMLGGRLLTGNSAKEQTFKRIGQKYSILHLAMHSIPDRTNSMNSGLVFTPGADRKDDGILFGHEIYNLSLNAWLTVLSACETGSGQLVGGEGILSFGRAFIVAGCPNLIMTLWTVDDRSSKEIMVNFYKALISGNGIAQALQKSKIDYLAGIDQMHAHPHYWAGFIELGQNQVLKLQNRKPGLVILLVIFSLTIAVLIFIQLKKNPRRSRDIMETE